MTTKVVVDPPGNCGFHTVIEVTRFSANRVKVSIASECPMLREMSGQLCEIDWRSALKPLVHSPVLHFAFQCVRHVACPIPIAVLKAIEVEVGMALPSDISIRFHTTIKK